MEDAISPMSPMFNGVQTGVVTLLLPVLVSLFLPSIKVAVSNQEVQFQLDSTMVPLNQRWGLIPGHWGFFSLHF